MAETNLYLPLPCKHLSQCNRQQRSRDAASAPLPSEGRRDAAARHVPGPAAVTKPRPSQALSVPSVRKKATWSTSSAPRLPPLPPHAGAEGGPAPALGAGTRGDEAEAARRRSPLASPPPGPLLALARLRGAGGPGSQLRGAHPDVHSRGKRAARRDAHAGRYVAPSTLPPRSERRVDS